ncbi:MAG: response regulator [Desulfobacterales bacterium]|nr:response regulator [Desulfobacterales bacterium]
MKMKTMMNNKGKLLLADDEPELIKFLKWQLETRSYTVNTAGSGEEALEMLEKSESDILIADIRMPGMDGIELMQKAMKYQPDLQCIVITGHGDIETAIEAMKLGAINYLRKPVGIDELDVAIEKGIEKLQLIQEVRDKQRKIEKTNQELTREKEKLRQANEELTKYRFHLEELLEEEIDRRKKAEGELSKVRIREALVEVLTMALRYWEQSTGKTKIELAEESRIWTVSNEKNGPRTRTLDKYLKLSRLPENIRINNVLNTVYFVLKKCPHDDPVIKEQLETKTMQIETMFRKLD